MKIKTQNRCRFYQKRSFPLFLGHLTFFKNRSGKPEIKCSRIFL